MEAFSLGFSKGLFHLGFRKDVHSFSWKDCKYILLRYQLHSWFDSTWPSHGLDIAIRHPGMSQDPFTWLTHCLLALGDIEINKKCCGLNFGLILAKSKMARQVLGRILT
jgi:hypothetical protein